MDCNVIVCSLDSSQTQCLNVKDVASYRRCSLHLVLPMSLGRVSESVCQSVCCSVTLKTLCNRNTSSMFSLIYEQHKSEDQSYAVVIIFDIIAIYKYNPRGMLS